MENQIPYTFTPVQENYIYAKNRSKIIQIDVAT